MAAQGRVRRDAEDVVEAVGPTPIENFGAVGPHQDLGAGPASADGAYEPAQEGLDLGAARPFGGTKHSGDEPALAVEHDDRLKAVFVIVGVEQPQLLAAMHRIEGIVDIERHPFGSPGEQLAIEVDHRPTHSQQRANVRQVLQSRDRRLRAQLPIRRRQIERHLEHRIAAQAIGVDPVLVAGADHQNPEPEDVRQAVGDLIGIARINQASRKSIGDPKPLVDFPQRQTPPSDDKSPPSNSTSTRLPETGDRPGNGNIESLMEGAARLKMQRIGFDNQILRNISRLSYSRHTNTHNPG